MRQPTALFVGLDVHKDSIAEEIADGVWSIYFCRVLLGRLDERDYLVRGLRSGNQVLPMLPVHSTEGEARIWRRRGRCYRCSRLLSLCRGFGRRVPRANRANVRSASLTARLSGKSSATSGSRSTTLVPSAYRAAVTPRTACEKSYSGRIVSASAFRLFESLVFILSSLAARRESGADDSCPGRPFSVRHDAPRFLGHSDYEKALLALRVIRIRHVQGQDVSEDRHGLVERNVVVFEIRGGLLRIPFETVRHRAILSSSGLVSRIDRLTLRMSRAPSRFSGASAPFACSAAPSLRGWALVRDWYAIGQALAGRHQLLGSTGSTEFGKALLVEPQTTRSCVLLRPWPAAREVDQGSGQDPQAPLREPRVYSLPTMRRPLRCEPVHHP